ncbi:MAG: NitT/TauT family transport system substrate-binding protein [Candidatus Eremiobacteraeota bacterium]|jgi:NitT/TauT family transport system substrate-binding protein|nr:NitT/TauT family transport system substrate-binding protein [Candidatus Eremiobacteraeota bacterium]MEA2719320.1 NitT/TauT family transport system substrate-binding protein [Candidatus Eremiobacteraeota bacterium]
MAPISRRTFVSLAAVAPLVPSMALAAGATAIRAASAGDDDVTPLLYAQQSGLLKRFALDANVQRMPSGSTVASGVIGGSFDIGKSSLLSLINARGRNVPIVIIAPAGVYDAAAPIGGLLVRADGPVKTAADLNGKVIAVSALNDLYTISTKAWLDQHGGDSSSIKLIELPISAVPEALAQGRIDAGNVLEPELQFALESGKVRVLAHPFDAIARRFLYTAWFTTKDYATKNRDVVDRFTRAMREAAAYTNAHHAETVGLLAEFTKVPAAVIGKATRSTAGTSIDPREVQHVIDVAYKYKAIPASFDARDLIDSGYHA